MTSSLPRRFGSASAMRIKPTIAELPVAAMALPQAGVFDVAASPLTRSTLAKEMPNWHDEAA